MTRFDDFISACDAGLAAADAVVMNLSLQEMGAVAALPEPPPR